jgi:hypothetical protein
VKPIWTRKREEKEALIADLIAQLDSIKTPEAKIMAGALDYYGFNKAGLPHKVFLKIRAEVIQKATDLLERARA